MEKRGLIPLVELLDEFGGWPMATNDWKENSFDWQAALTHHVMFPTPLISITVHKDSKNSTQRVIYVSRFSFTNSKQK